MGKGSIGENRGAGREGAAKEVRDGLGSSVFNVQIGQMGWPLLVVNLIYQAHETAGAENSSLERAAAAAVEGWGKPHCSTRRWNYVHWGCGEDASTDERWDCVSGKCVSANVSTQVKRRWNHPRSGRDSFYSYCHPFHADSYVPHPMPADSYHHLLPDLLLCPAVRVTPFVLAFQQLTPIHSALVWARRGGI